MEETESRKKLQHLVDEKNYIPHLSVDCTIFGFHNNILKVLLLRHPDFDRWALPGGYIYQNEDLRVAADRVLFERTHLTGVFLEQFHTFGRVNRTDDFVHQSVLKNRNIEFDENLWILDRFITVGYCSLIDFSKADSFPNSNTEICEWFEVKNLPQMIFDHARIVEEGYLYLQKNIDTQIAASNLLPEKFTMKELQQVYETILGEEFRRNNFQRKILNSNSLERLEKFYSGSANKAPYLYRFKKD
jgi:ADP-ribose pyrophosphatase YjhB (NUDIX family)